MAEKITEWMLVPSHYVVILSVLIIVCIFGIYKAITSTVKHNRLFHEEEEKMKKLRELKTKFENLTAEAVNVATDEDLVAGVALHYQLKLQKEPDMEKVFNKIPEYAQIAYTADIFLSEGEDIAKFYKENGWPLTEILPRVFGVIGDSETEKTVSGIAEMYDETREDVSLDYKKVNALKEKFISLYNREETVRGLAEYIRKEFISI